MDFLKPMPEADYRAHPALSSSQLRDFHESARLYWQRHCGSAKQPDTQALLMGRMCHKYILEGKAAFEAAFALATDAPVNPKTNKTFGRDSIPFTKWEAEQGRPVVTIEEAALCKTLARCVREQHPEVLTGNGVAEHVAMATIEGKQCRVRLDWFNGECIDDLKTTADLRWFEQECDRNGYVQRLAFYRDVVAAASGGVVYPVRIVAVEKKPPYAVGVWVIAEDALDAWSARNRAAIKRLVECETNNYWPTGYEETRILGA